MHGNENLRKEVVGARKMLEHHAMYLTKDQEWANDLLQDTLLRILSKSDKYKEQGRFDAWARSVMKHIFLNDQTSNEKHKDTFVEGFNYIKEDYSHPSVAENDSKYIIEDIRKAIEMLPERYADMIRMQIAGYKYEEIAQKMGISIGCVKSTLFAAKNQLKKMLGTCYRHDI